MFKIDLIISPCFSVKVVLILEGKTEVFPPTAFRRPRLSTRDSPPIMSNFKEFSAKKPENNVLFLQKLMINFRILPMYRYIKGVHIFVFMENQVLSFVFSVSISGKN